MAWLATFKKLRFHGICVDGRSKRKKKCVLNQIWIRVEEQNRLKNDAFGVWTEKVLKTDLVFKKKKRIHMDRALIGRWAQIVAKQVTQIIARGVTLGNVRKIVVALSRSVGRVEPRCVCNKTMRDISVTEYVTLGNVSCNLYRNKLGDKLHERNNFNYLPWTTLVNRHVL